MLWKAGHEEPLRLARLGLRLARLDRIGEAVTQWTRADSLLQRLTGRRPFDEFAPSRRPSSPTRRDRGHTRRLDDDVRSSDDALAAQAALDALRDRVGTERLVTLMDKRRNRGPQHRFPDRR